MVCAIAIFALQSESDEHRTHFRRSFHYLLAVHTDAFAAVMPYGWQFTGLLPYGQQRAYSLNQLLSTCLHTNGICLHCVLLYAASTASQWI